MDVDKKIEKLLSTKGDYITQAVAFNKNCPRQMALLKYALSESSSFSGLVKELIALRMSGSTLQVQTPSETFTTSQKPNTSVLERPRVKDLGNFI